MRCGYRQWHHVNDNRRFIYAIWIERTPVDCEWSEWKVSIEFQILHTKSVSLTFWWALQRTCSPIAPWNTMHSQWSTSFAAAKVYRLISWFCPWSSLSPICERGKRGKSRKINGKFQFFRPKIQLTDSWNPLPPLPFGWNPNCAMCFCKHFRRHLCTTAESRILPARKCHFRRQSSAAFQFGFVWCAFFVATDLEYCPRRLDVYAKDLESPEQYLPSANRILRALSTNSVPNPDLRAEKHWRNRWQWILIDIFDCSGVIPSLNLSNCINSSYVCPFEPISKTLNTPKMLSGENTTAFSLLVFITVVPISCANCRTSRETSADTRASNLGSCTVDCWLNWGAASVRDASM